jgi:hypothetical protein
MLYKSILQNTYANTTPVDFVPLPGNGDVVYITRTSVGYISTKRSVLYDRSNPGFCRATNLLYCPHGFFGTVGSVCASCTNTSHPMYGRSVAWQVKCAAIDLRANASSAQQRRLLSQSGKTAPYERFSMVLGTIAKNVTAIASTIHAAIAQYADTKGVPAPTHNETFLSPMQQYNMAADAMASLIANPQPETLVPCLIGAAESEHKRALFKNNTQSLGAEFTSTIVSYAVGQPILQAMSQPVVKVSAAPQCSSALLRKDPLRGWLQCSVLGQTSTLTGRRLLADPTPDMLIIEHQGTTLGSNTVVSWSAETAPPTNNPAPDTQQQQQRALDTPSESSTAFPIWAAAVVAGVGLIIVVFIVYMVYRNRHAATTTTRQASYKTKGG